MNTAVPAGIVAPSATGTFPRMEAAPSANVIVRSEIFSPGFRTVQLAAGSILGVAVLAAGVVVAGAPMFMDCKYQKRAWKLVLKR